jgi:hypothetical protein
MFGNMFKSMEYSKKANILYKNLKGGEGSNQKSCKCCSFCCWLKPCNLSKEDIAIMAKHFHLTRKKLFKKYLVVDTASAKDGHFTLTPIRKEWQSYAGKYLPSNATYDINTPCTFLDETTKKCTLHGLAKPYGGRTAKCWTKMVGKVHSFSKDELKKIVGWDGDTNWDD